jgi:toxin ParE1/3/4
MKTIIVDPEAQAELDAAAQWYGERKKGLGTEFLDAVAEAIARIQKYPKVFPLFRDTEIRKYPMKRFPYLIFFEEFHAHIAVYAFAHAKRKPGYWLSRSANEDDGNG